MSTAPATGGAPSLTRPPRRAAFGRYDGDRDLHITYKELKAVRYAVLTFLSELRGRHVLLHDDNMGVIHILPDLTSRSPLLMTELWKLWFILDTNEISIIHPCALHQDHSQNLG
eukprot:jgi/Tetstr1/441328/TSEL_029579.t1